MTRRANRYSRKIEGLDAILSLPQVTRQERDEERTSDKYSVVSTGHVIELMAGLGWQPVSAFTQSRRGQGHTDTTKHCVEFEQPDFRTDTRQLGGLTPRLTLINSHDGSGSLHFVAGFQRLVCLNGLMVGHESAHMRQRHVGINPSVLEERILAVAQSIDTLRTRFESLHSVELTEEQIRLLTVRALQLRHGQQVGEQTDYLVQRIQHARRADDRGQTAFNLFNRLQEAIVRGGYVYTQADGSLSDRTRPITNVFRQNELTQSLYQETLKLVA